MHLYIHSRSLTGSSASPGRISAQQLMTTFSFHSINKKETMCIKVRPITPKYLYPLKTRITLVTHNHGLHTGALSYPNTWRESMAYTRCFVCTPWNLFFRGGGGEKQRFLLQPQVVGMLCQRRKWHKFFFSLFFIKLATNWKQCTDADTEPVILRVNSCQVIWTQLQDEILQIE